VSTQGSISLWLDQLKAGSSAAAQPLWEAYFQKLVRLARHKLRGIPRAVGDEEDVALSAFDSFCRGAEAGRFPRLEDRHDLWQILLMLTARKAVNLIQYETRQKRGGGQIFQASALAGQPDDGSAQDALARVIGPEPSPEFAAQVAEECQLLIQRLPDAQLQAIALAKMDGYTNEEIARRVGCSLATVERRLSLIRKIWEREGPP
jgi:DNA-directed RNA polymerase specialized sigma24 family protein